jgi:NAD(P)-dependent dehydrogenase (short-subunit alcohol dehydrogenase family)
LVKPPRCSWQRRLHRCGELSPQHQGGNGCHQTIVDAGGKAFAVRADISDEAQVLAMFESLDREGEPLTALVNNAGILFEQSTIENLSAERINRVLATNVTGYFLCCREAVKRMSHKHGGKGGAIVNVSSAASRLGAPGNMWTMPRRKGRWIP